MRTGSELRDCGLSAGDCETIDFEVEKVFVDEKGVTSCIFVRSCF